MTRLRLLCASLALALTVAPLAVPAETPASPAVQVPAEVLDHVWQVLDIPASLAILRQEGQDMAGDVARDYLPAKPGTGWNSAVEAIYDPAAMDRLMRKAFARDFAGTDPAPVIDFFDSALGRRIVALELSARAAFLDPDTETAAHERIERGLVEEARSRQIAEFIAVNDLVEFNLTGALNTNLAFLSGLAEAELFDMSEDEILNRVYENAEETRADTEDWLRAYLTMAYQPLSDEDLAAYIAFSARPEGQRLNRALFAGFGEMYDAQYLALGRAVARQLGAQDL